jgi:hypothetical protein
MHILHDDAVKNSPSPCGFCLLPDSRCIVRLKKGRGQKGSHHINWDNTICQHGNKVSLSIKTFQKSTTTSPCTNIPMNCPICPSGSNAIWKYNLQNHITTVHPTANIEEYKTLFEVSKFERVMLKQWWRAKPRFSPCRFRNLGDIHISDAHCACLATR